MDFIIFVALFLVALLLAVPLGLVVAHYRTRTRIMRLEAALEEQKAALSRLSAQVAGLRGETRVPVGAADRVERAPTGAGIRAEPPRGIPSERPSASGPPAAPVRPAPPVSPTPPTRPAPPLPAGIAERAGLEPPLAKPVSPQSSPAGGVAAGAAPLAERPPVPPRPASPSGLPRPPRPQRVASPAFDWESLVGVKLFSAVAGVALVMAAILFLRYSMQQGWLQPPVRALIGIAVAVTLLVLCELKAARRYPATANALDAAAVAILFATFFAAHALWALIPGPLAFGLLGAVTALAVLLSIRRESAFIAVLGLLGGFATPALLSSGENRPIPLFAYLVLLNVGVAWVAHRQVWPALTSLTLVLTTIYQWVWVGRFLTAADLPLAAAIFAIFPVLSLLPVLFGRRGQARHAADDAFERPAVVGAALPLAFVAYLAAVPAYGSHPALLFAFLLVVDAGLFAVALALGRTALHAVGAVATVFVWAVWLTASYGPGVRATAVVFATASVLLYGFAPAVAERLARPLRGSAREAVYAAPALLFVFVVMAAIDPGAAAAPLFAPLLGLVIVCAWRAMALDRGMIFFIASFMAVGTQAVWSVRHLTAGRVPVAVLVYGLFGVTASLVPVLARRRGTPLRPETGPGLVLLASLLLLVFLSGARVSPAALWGLALLLAVINAGVFVESASAGLPRLAQAGSVISWMVMGLWWVDTAGVVGVLPSLAVVTGLALLTLGGHAWVHAASPPTAARGARRPRGVFLGLLGHLFLILLALNPAWSVPPWPLFGSLAVVTLAASAAAAAAGSPMLHVGGILGAAAAVAGWTLAAATPAWAPTALLASAVLSAYALAWVPLARTGRRSPGLAAEGAASALFASEAIAILTASAHAPPFHALLLLHVVNLALLLTLTFATGWRGAASGAVGIAALALFELQAGPGLATRWAELLVLSSALYAVFVAYALIAGPRQPERREPWLAALAAATAAFFAGRAAFEAGELERVIALVPLSLGAVTAVLLRRLLRLDAAGRRDTTRLALVAAGALAFATVAIPLQLDHQWITIGWALEGAALAWLYRRVPHRGLLMACAALLGTVFIRLVLNPAVWTYEPRGELRILNWYLYTYLLAAAAVLLAGWLLSGTNDRLGASLPRASRLLPAAGVILLFLLLNIEIADYYATGPQITFRFGATVGQDLTYTIGWLAFGILLLAAGIYLRNRPARVTAVALIAVTTFKCFLHDLGSLEGLHRIASFVGLAIALALVALALQKYVLPRPKGTV